MNKNNKIIVVCVLLLTVCVIILISIEPEETQNKIVQNSVQNVENFSAELCEYDVFVEKDSEPTTENNHKQIIVIATAYCSCEKCCGKSDGITATGTKATQGRTIAVDPDVIPYGTIVMFAGNRYIAEDCGAFSGNKIDVYFENHNDALQFGRKTIEIEIQES